MSAANLKLSRVFPYHNIKINKNGKRTQKIHIATAFFLEISPLTKGLPCSSFISLSSSTSA